MLASAHVLTARRRHLPCTIVNALSHERAFLTDPCWIASLLAAFSFSQAHTHRQSVRRSSLEVPMGR